MSSKGLARHHGGRGPGQGRGEVVGCSCVGGEEEGAMSRAAGRRGVWIGGPCTVPKRVAIEGGAT